MGLERTPNYLTRTGDVSGGPAVTKKGQLITNKSQIKAANGKSHNFYTHTARAELAEYLLEILIQRQYIRSQYISF